MLNPINDKSFDVTKNIRTIEFLKSRLLSEIAFLYENMLNSEADSSERIDIISEIIMISYILSNKLGISYSQLDKKITAKLKVSILEEDNNYNSLSSLLKYIDNRILE